MSTQSTNRWRRLGIVLFGLVAASCQQAAPLDHGYAGTWIMLVNDQPFYVLKLQQNGDSFAGKLGGPEHWSTGTGVRFTEVTPQVLTRSFSSVSKNGQALHLVIENPKDKTDTDEFDLMLIDDDRASLAWTGYPFSPFSFVRSRDPLVSVSTSWDPKVVYALAPPPEMPNADMATIYDEDQKARQSIDPSTPQWASIEKDDAQRRVRARALIDSGQLKAGQDFRKAAFVFQHGTQPDDYLLAHTLALVALAKGDIEARWIATATLDRYLHTIGKAQIYGAGFEIKHGQVTAQEPFNRTLVSDDLRQALGVPPLADQLNQFKSAMQTLKEPAAGDSK